MSSYTTSTATPVQTQAEASWSTGLFSCFDDVPNCCITCCCPCITFGQIAEIVDEGKMSWAANAAIYALIAFFTGGCQCCYSCCYRTKMRKQYRLNESPCADCCVHFFCETCSLCQEYRELKNRGFNMSEGWKQNVDRQNYGIQMAPVVEERMTK